MDIIIPTYGRATEQVTLRQLVAAGLSCTLVVQERERGLYTQWQHDANIIVLPDYIRTIAPTRQYILENVGTTNRLIMVDDDLLFYKRREDDDAKLRETSKNELTSAFLAMDDFLGRYAHAGFASREGANRNTDDLIYNTRIMRVLGYQRDVLKANNIRFDAMEVMEDFHVALQLLENGLPNVILNDIAHNQGGSGSKGGCSHFRTPELHSRNARKLAELHPDFVKVVQKTTKGSFGGGTRDDVIVQWKKAYAHGTANR